ncbi:winged helix-turn-helix transcriptional regulator [Desulfotignum balticum]|jgi:predicted transcriptional regulator|nr:winged helix-turn-helix transcriptional regulator [Desulfotignum balticum]
MILLSPPKACDPWAAYCAKSFSEKTGSRPDLNPVQVKILQILKETGGISIQELSEQLELPLETFERDIAALRHMEKLRAEMRGGRKIICLWQNND